MPLWDFSCNCGQQLKDVWLKIGEDTPENRPVCPNCKQAMEKDPPRVNAQFRGRGFHATDYRAPTRGY